MGADPSIFHRAHIAFVGDPIFTDTAKEADPFQGRDRLIHVPKDKPEVDFVPPYVNVLPPGVRRQSSGGGATGIIRDPVTGLIVDGREGWLLTRLYSILRTRLDQGESIDFADVEAVAWAEFEAECDLTGWSRAAVASKVHATLDRYHSGALPGLRRGTTTGLTPYYEPHLTPIADIRTALAVAGSEFFASKALEHE